MKFISILLCAGIVQLPLFSQVLVQGDLPMPALPKENLPTELAESRAFVVRLERELAYVSDRYPALAKEVELANTAWNASPFYAATRSIEKVIIDVQGDRGRQLMQEMDKLIENESENAHRGMTIVDAVSGH